MNLVLPGKGGGKVEAGISEVDCRRPIRRALNPDEPPDFNFVPAPSHSKVTRFAVHDALGLARYCSRVVNSFSVGTCQPLGQIP
jgi:hypothetical protein